MNESTRQEVRARAGDRCEYCRLRQEHFRLWRHQVEHVIPRKHHGSDDLENLALACIRCNLGKSSNLTGRDEETGDIVPLFKIKANTRLTRGTAKMLIHKLAMFVARRPRDNQK